MHQEDILLNKTQKDSHFDLHHTLHDLKHYLPAQAPLKDFIHHNTLHAFQKQKFHDALRSASEILGYKVSLTLSEFRKFYKEGRIQSQVLDRIIVGLKGEKNLPQWKSIVLEKEFENNSLPRIGALRANWKKEYQMDMDSQVHPILFRTLCNYLDQGISMWNFPVWHKGFLSSIREMEKNSFTSFFKTKRAREILLNTRVEIPDLLDILVHDPSLNQQYLFDLEFAHQGWSGMVSSIEDFPETLLDRRHITLQDVIIFELLLEIDALDSHFGEVWSPLSIKIKNRPVELFSEVPATELSDVFMIWQEAFEWSYYDEVLCGLQHNEKQKKKEIAKKFQAMFCIDDRECSLRRYLEKLDPTCETFGTPGFFGVEFYFQPEHGKFYTKLCPAPVTPKFLIKELGTKGKRDRDVHMAKQTHGLLGGWLISQTLGFWSAFQLFLNLFKPSMSPATASSFRHMDKQSKLTIECKHPEHQENHLQIGFTIDEMVNRTEGLLKGIGLVEDFAPIVYVVGHGSSSVNNPHFAAYDCGACSGRPGSVNARVLCFMANHPAVRKQLKERGINIPEETQFIGGLHDTTRDEIEFYDELTLSLENQSRHKENVEVFIQALDANAKERSRRFESINTHKSARNIHKRILSRSVSLFEPRPELNHATNALCIVGRRELTKGVFLDRRSFLNSFNYKVDPEGKFLLGIMKPLGPVCGGINLEYFFSRVDNQKLGAGTKLPHNVMGLFGVANGIDGDLRPGLPSQMIEVHDPVRLLIIVEHFPEVVLKTIQTAPETYEWFINEWVNLVAVNPETRELYHFKNGAFHLYETVAKSIEDASSVDALIESTQDNLHVYHLA